MSEEDSEDMKQFYKDLEQWKLDMTPPVLRKDGIHIEGRSFE